MDFSKKTALQIGQMIKNKEISSIEITKYTLENIKKNDGFINSYISVFEETAIENSKKVQAKIDKGEFLSPLAGVPMAIKDNICTKGKKTTCASKMLENFVPPYNATVVEKLENAGSILLGKLNMDEFAMGSSTETSYFGATKNPWDLTRVSGGSSGGSATAVISDEAFFSLGSDTGGSIRQPCSFCGVSGIKPTYSSVSRYGLIAFASSLDQIGPIGKDIKDCTAILDIISGFDKKDSTSTKFPKMDFSESFSGNIKGIKIGIPKNYFNCGIDEDVKVSIFEAIETFKRLGAEIYEFEMPIIDYAIPTYYILACAEASSNLSRYDGIKYGFRSEKSDNLLDVFFNSRSEGFGLEVKRRIMLGSFVLSSGYYDDYYKKGLKVRNLIKNNFEEIFSKYDVILMPTAPTTAFKIGEKISDPLKMYLDDIYTVSVNLAGIPAVNIPCGFGKTGLPIGMQLIGKAFFEPLLVKVANVFQLNTDFHLQKPSFKGGQQ